MPTKDATIILEEKKLAAQIVVAYLQKNDTKSGLDCNPDKIADYFRIVFDKIHECE